MNLRSEIAQLRREVESLASLADTGIVRRYALWHPPGQRRTLYRRVRRAVGSLLRRTGLRRSQPSEPWLTGLKHTVVDDRACTVVIWAVGADREQLRGACAGLGRIFADLPGHTPVLITDVADFAFFSRLGWLVEYVPRLSGPADDYRERKQRYLAWRYREAPALPYSVGLREGLRAEDLLLD